MKVYEAVALQSKKTDDEGVFVTSHPRELSERSSRTKKATLQKHRRHFRRAPIVVHTHIIPAVLNVQNHQFSDEIFAAWAEKIEQQWNDFDVTGKLSPDFFDFD